MGVRERYEEKLKRKKAYSEIDLESVGGVKGRYLRDKYYSTLDTSVVNEDYLNSLVDDVNKFYTDSDNAYKGLDWGTANTTYDTISNERNALLQRAYVVDAWLRQNKDTMSAESYKSLEDMIAQIGTGTKSVLEGFGSARDYFGNWKSADEYSAWDNKQKFISAYLEDPEKAKRDYKYEHSWLKEAEDKKLHSDALKAEDFKELSEKGLAIENPSALAGQGGGMGFNYFNFKTGEASVYRPFAADVGNVATFVRDANKNNNLSALTDWERQKYLFMNDEEVAVYSYYLAKYGKDKAEEYFKSLESTLNEREAGVYVDATSKSDLLKIAFAVSAGADQFKTGIQNLFRNKDYYNPTAIQIAGSAMREDLGKVGQVAYDITQTTANMLPSILISSIPVVGNYLGVASMGASAGGNAYAEMKNLGYTDGQARTYATLVGASEAALQKVLGGISFGGKGASGVFDRIATKFIDKVDNAIARVAISVGAGMLDEGLEEGLQEVLAPYFEQIATMGEAEFDGIDWDNVLYSAVLGAVTGGMLEGAPNIVNTAISSNRANQLYGNVQQDLVTKSLDINPENAHAQRMQERLDRGEKLSGYQLNRLNEANAETLVAEKAKDIKARLAELGEVWDIDNVANAIAKRVKGQPLTAAESKALKNSRYAQTVIDEDYSYLGGKKKESKVNTSTSAPSAKVTESAGFESVLEDIADDWIENDDSITDEVSSSMVKGYDGSIPVSSYAKAYKIAYEIGANGLPSSKLAGVLNSGISERVAYTAYQLGKNYSESLKSDTNGDIINNNTEATNESAEGIHLRNGGKRDGSKDSEKQISRVESDSGKNKERTETRNAADSEAARLVNEGREVKVADLGILGGSTEQTVVLVDKAKETPTMKKARARAEARGLKVTFFVGDNLVVKEKEGWISARGYIKGVQIFVRADYEGFTADQLIRHEIGHDMIAKGEINVQEVIDRLIERIDAENVDTIAEYYASAYAGSQMTEMEIWEECICDSLGDMNVFSKTDANQFMQDFLADIKTAAESETKSPTQTRGSPTSTKTQPGNVVNVIEDGQFYKVRGEDAVRLSKAVDLTLTQETVNGEKVPMVGFPLRYFDTYADKAAKKGITLNKEAAKYSYSSIVYSFFGDKSVSIEDLENGSYKDTDGYKKYVDDCLNNMRQSVIGFRENTALAEIKESIDGIVKVAVAMKKAGYDILDNHAKRNAVDSKNRLLFSSLEPNSDYFTSSDISTICDKRINFAEIYDEIVRREEDMNVPKNKRFFNNIDNYFVLHKILAEKGLTAPCRQCYVESMRKNLDPMANAFIELMQETDPNNKANKQLYQPSGKNKGELKSNNAKLRENLLEVIEREKYDITANELTIKMLTTADGLAQLKLQAPLIYEAFNSFYGQSKPKMPKAATPFRFGELTALLTDDKGKIKTGLVRQIVSTGGFRLQSYSDFQIQNFVDVLQVIFEAGTLGLNGHAYTKVPAFLDATKGTNLKRNISIFMYKDGNQWKIDRGDSFPYTLEEIYDIVDADKSGNTGIIAVVQNEDMAAWIMANDNIGYFIPFHKSGVKMGVVRETIVREGDRKIQGYLGIKDHTRQQTEVWAKTTADHKANTKVKNGINIYEFWDFNNSGDLSKKELIEKNVMAYIDACNEAGYLPKFREYLMDNGKVLNKVLSYAKELGFVAQTATIDDISFEYSGYRIPYGYYKCLGDFGMFTPDGEASPVKRLSLKNYNFKDAVKFFSDVNTLRRNEILQQFENGSERETYRESKMTTAELAEEIQNRRNQVVDEVVSGKASRELESEDYQDLNEKNILFEGASVNEQKHQDTGVLAGRVLSAANKGENILWNGSNDSQILREGMARSGDTRQVAYRSGNDRRASSGYLSRTDIVSSYDFKRLTKSILRDSTRELSERDSSGRKLPEKIKESFKDTIFKNENGELLSAFHWTPNIFAIFAYGDIGFHFGTHNSALDRRKGKESELGKDIIKEVYLNIKKPIFLEDYGYWDGSSIAPQLFEKGLIDSATNTRLQRTKGYVDGEYNDAANVAIRKILDDLGYDGIIYQNTAEDKGTLSVAALYPDQIYTVTEGKAVVDEKSNGKSSRELDTTYLDAVNRGDMLTAQKMVDEAAKEAGYNSPKLYHGTKMFGFTKIKTSGVEKGAAWSPFFAANKKDISATYVPYGKVRDISSSMDEDAIEEARETAIEERRENISDLVYDFRKLIDRHFSPWVFGQTDNSYLEGLVENANPEAGYGDGVYDVLSEIVYDSFYDYRDEFGEYEDTDDWAENSPEGKEIFSLIGEIEGEKSALYRLESGEELGGIYQLYANLDNMYVVDGKGAAWNDLRPEGLPKIERHGIKDVPYKTRDVADWARANGFDGVIFKNIRDNGAYGRTPAGDVYAFFSPESQVKSADPVTYDDNGNVIPLSERFNPTNSDIRYSRELDTFNNELHEWYNTTSEEERSKSGKRFHVAKTTPVLKSIGVKDSSVYFGAAKINKILKDNKSMSIDTISEVVRLLHEPILIMESKTVADSIVIFGDVYTDGKKPVMVSLLVNPKDKNGEILDYIVITSAYGRRISNLQNLINTSRIYYIGENKKRTDSWLKALGLQLPSALTTYGSIDSIIENPPKVNTLDQNSSKNLSGKTSRELEFLDYLNETASEEASKPLSNRELLANALESTVQNEVEAKKLADYKSKIDALNTQSLKLAEIKKEIKEISFSKGKRNTTRLNELKLEAVKTENRINLYDKKLLDLESTKALKDVLEREKVKARKEAARKTKEELALAREKFEKREQNIVEHYRASRMKGIESRNTTAVRHKLLNKVHDLDSYLRKGTKEKHVPIELQKPVAEALNAINMDTVDAEARIAKKREELMKAKSPEARKKLEKEIEHIKETGERLGANLANLKVAYDSIINSDDPIIANSHDEVISNTIQAVIEKVGNTPLRNMTLSQLEAVYDMYKMVLHSVRAANKAHKAKRAAEISEISNAVRSELAKRPVLSKDKTRLAIALANFGWNNLKPIYAFERIDSETFTELFNNIRAGEDVWAVDMDEAFKFREEQEQKYNFSEWDFDKLVDFESVSGDKFSLNLGQMLSIYAYIKRGDQAIDHLRKGGFVFDTLTKISRKGKTDVYLKDSTAYNLSDQLLIDIISNLTPEQKAFADEMQRYLSEVMGEKGNEVSLVLYGVKLFKEKFYFPLKSSPVFLEQAREQANGEVKVKNKGFTKETTPNASNPIVLTSFMDVWANHVQEMSMYHAFILALEDFYRVYNMKTPAIEGVRSESVRGDIEKTSGDAATAYIDQFLKDVNGGTRSDPRETFAKSLVSRFKKTAVMGSLSVIVQQPTALYRAMALVDAKYFGFAPISRGVASTFNIKKHKALWEEVKKYAPIAIVKEMGHFDTGMGKSSVEWLKGEKSFMDKVDDALSKGAEIADELAWISIWNAVKKETASKNPTLATNSEEFLKLAGERFTEVIVKTQVYDSTLSKSAFMRSKSAFMNMWTAFMAEPTTSINMVMNAIRKGGGKNIAKVLGAVLGSVAINSALVSLVYAMRDEDEDETYAEKYVSRFTTELVDGINPITYLPFFKDVWSVMQGFDVERADMTLITELTETLRKTTDVLSTDTSNMSEEQLKEHQGKLAEALWSIVDSISSIAGIPEKNIRRDIEGIINLFKTVGRDMDTSFGSLMDNVKDDLKDSVPIWGWLPDEKKGDKLYDAIVSGDKTYVERIKSTYKSESAYGSALNKALRDNDSRIKKAAVARSKGDYDEYKRIAREIIAEGYFKQDNVVAAIMAEEKALKGSSTTSDATSSKTEYFYKADDINVAFDNGDTALALEIIKELIEAKMADGKTEKEAKSSLRSAMTSYWKPLYKEATQDEKARIRKILKNSGLYGGADDVLKTVNSW